jgi:hypothetical protein
MQVRSKKYILLISFIISALVVIFSGCTNSSTNPTATTDRNSSVERSTLPDDPVAVQNLMSAGYRPVVRHNQMSVFGGYYKEQLIHSNISISQTLGDDYRACAVFPVGSLYSDLYASIEVPNSTIPRVIFGPHPTQFKAGVTVRIS